MGRATYQFIRTQDSELHSLDGAQRACAVSGGGATPVHGGAGVLRRRKPRYKKPAPPPPRRSDPVRAATRKDLSEAGGKGCGGGGWKREEAGKHKGPRGSLCSLSGDFSALQRKQKEGRKGEGLGEEEEEKG